MQKRGSQNQSSPDYRESIIDLLRSGAIKKAKYYKDEFISSYFLRKKPNGKKRFILNLKTLNSFLHCPHFKLEDFRSVKVLISESCYMAKIDLKDAYFSI